MTNEEIRQIAKNKYPYIKGLPQTVAHQEIFIEGAKLANEKTKKGVINKACKWLEDNLFNYPWYDNEAPNFTVNDVINDFKKAMEE